MFVNIKIIYFIQIILWIIFFTLPIIVAKKSKDKFIKKYFKNIIMSVLVFTIILYIKSEYIDYVSDICINDNDVSSYSGVPPVSCEEFYKHKQFYGVGWPVTLFFMSILEIIYAFFIFFLFPLAKWKQRPIKNKKHQKNIKPN